MRLFILILFVLSVACESRNSPKSKSSLDMEEYDDDIVDGGDTNQPNEKKITVSTEDLDYNVTKMEMKRNGEHYELLFTVELEDGEISYIRISRNNSTDRFTFRAQDYDLATVGDPVEFDGKTVEDILLAFTSAHCDRPCYEGANCQAFADEVWSRLTSKRSPAYEDMDGFF